MDSRYNDFIEKMKDCILEGKVEEAIMQAERAYTLNESDKLRKKIQRMKAYLEEEAEKGDGDVDGTGVTDFGDGFFLNNTLSKKLYPYQREGVIWMWNLNRAKKGGILGDDMGLGKTLQIIAFLCGLFEQEVIKNALILLPVTLVANWSKEFEKWAPDIFVEEYHSGTKRQRDQCLRNIQVKGGVLLSTYGMIVNNWDALSTRNYKKFTWDYVILDEGHKIKNANKTTRSVHEIPAKNRLVLSGTPLQNNLSELWSLFDFVHQGTLLGTSKTFKMEFEAPINQSRRKDATAHEKRLGNDMAEVLRKRIAPYFLRRTKAQVFGNNDNSPSDGATRPKSLMRKNDFVVWVYLSPEQIKLYTAFIEDESVKEILNTNKSPLMHLNVLKKICDHPRLMSGRACAQLQMEGHERYLDQDDIYSKPDIKSVADSTLLAESGKLEILLQLLKELRAKGHRTLVFSQSRLVLDIIQRLLNADGVKVIRIDGTIKGSIERQDLVRKFEKHTSYSVCLLTSQVGGVGLTLTGADRVVIYDPSWNPATDSQAVDRAYRIGQSKTVIVYRLITCGTVEEKIYRRQVFKDSITRQATGDVNPFRYFSRSELHDMFTLEDFKASNTQIQLENMHANQRKTDTDLDAHIAYLYSLNIFGISDHDLLFTVNPEDEKVDEANKAVIVQQISRAAQLVNEDCERTRQAILTGGRYVRDDIPATPKTPFNPSRSPDTSPDASPDTNNFPKPNVPKIVQPTFAPKELTDVVSDRFKAISIGDHARKGTVPNISGALPDPLPVPSHPATTTHLTPNPRSIVTTLPTPSGRREPKTALLVPEPIVVDETPENSDGDYDSDDVESPILSGSSVGHDYTRGLKSPTRKPIIQVDESLLVDDDEVTDSDQDDEVTNSDQDDDDDECEADGFGNRSIIPDEAFSKSPMKVQKLANEDDMRRASSLRRKSMLQSIIAHATNDNEADNGESDKFEGSYAASDDTRSSYHTVDGEDSLESSRASAKSDCTANEHSRDSSYNASKLSDENRSGKRSPGEKRHRTNLSDRSGSSDSAEETISPGSNDSEQSGNGGKHSLEQSYLDKTMEDDSFVVSANRGKVGKRNRVYVIDSDSE